MSKFKVKNPPFWKYALGVILLITTAIALPYILTGIGVSLAAIITSSIVEKGSGKLGKDVIVGGKNGPYLRLRVKPSNPKTQAQMTSRGIWVQLAKEWKTLTATQQSTFCSLAAVTPFANRLGFKRTISGFQLWMKINKPLMTAGVPVITDPSAYSGVGIDSLMPSYPVANITYDTTTKLMKTFTLDFASLPVGEGPTYLVLKCSSTLLSMGVNSYKSRRYVDLLSTVTTDITEPVDIYAAFNGIFGVQPNTFTKQIFLEFYQIDSVTGNMSAKQYVAIPLVPPLS